MRQRGCQQALRIHLQLNLDFTLHHGHNLNPIVSWYSLKGMDGSSSLNGSTAISEDVTQAIGKFKKRDPFSIPFNCLNLITLSGSSRFSAKHGLYGCAQSSAQIWVRFPVTMPGAATYRQCGPSSSSPIPTSLFQH